MPVPSSADRYETHVDRLIRESMERGDFDDLPGEGKRLPGAGSVDDELWWVRRWIKRNRRPEDGSRGDEPERSQSPSSPS